MTISADPVRPQQNTPQLSVNARAVEHLLAELVRLHGGAVTTTVPPLGIELRLSTRAVQRALRELEDAGRISADRPPRGPVTYRVLDLP